MNIAVWSYKGGVGKTTLAFHFADALCMRGYSVALMDLDPQGSTTSLSKINDESIQSGTQEDKGFLFDLYPDEEASLLNASTDDFLKSVHQVKSNGYDLVLSEYGPGIPGTQIGKRHDLVLVPFQPCRTDMEAAIRGVKSLPPGVQIIPVLTRFKAQNATHRQFYDMACKVFGSNEVLLMHEATIFQNCNNVARSVYTMPKGVYGLLKAKASMDLLAQKVLEKLDLPFEKETTK